MRHVIPLALASLLVAQDPASRPAAQDPASRPRAEPWVVYSGHAGPAHGKRIVFVTGDEEYRSEEGMPQLARILARLGGHCTVLFAIDKKTGAIDPGVLDHIPGLEALDHADLMVLFTRFRDLPDAQMKHIADYVETGRPIVALRTATHAFDPKTSKTYERYGWRSKTWEGGFGRQVLGETWVAHHGGHGTQSTLGVLPDTLEDRPLLRGLAGATIWDSTDVYAVRLPLPEGCTPLVHGQVLAGMTPDSGPAPARKDTKSGKTIDLNLPMMPLAWTREWKAPSGKTARVFTTTLGSAQGFAQEGTRRLLVNACLWALGREESITPDLDVSLASAFDPTPFGFGKHKRGVRPADLAWPVPASGR
jgi:type 1 glutamine amidotransferase